jgi:hypothetical protein
MHDSHSPPPTGGAVPLDAQVHLDAAGRSEGILCAGCNQIIVAGFEYVSIEVKMEGTEAAIQRSRAFLCDRECCTGKREEAVEKASAWRPCRPWHVPSAGEAETTHDPSSNGAP